MGRRSTHLRDRTVTIGDVVRNGQGINLYCDCGHRVSYPPAQLAGMAPAALRLWDFKRRARCSMCRRGGAADAIFLNLFVVAAPFTPEFGGQKV